MPVSVTPVLLAADPADGTRTALFVGGTSGNDVISIRPANAAGTDLAVTVNGADLGTFSPTGSLYVFGGAGDDTITLQTAVIGGATVSVAVPALLYGGAGNDTLHAGGSTAANVLLGDSGNDVLLGGAGHDLLIGGAGADRLQVGAGQGILIGGATAYDADAAALTALAAEWGRPTNYGTRVNHLSGDGRGLNSPYVLTRVTVRSDGSVDRLSGGASPDWFFLTAAGPATELFANFTDGEEVTLL